jgi:hypothetical protein
VHTHWHTHTTIWRRLLNVLYIWRMTMLLFSRKRKRIASRFIE